MVTKKTKNTLKHTNAAVSRPNNLEAMRQNFQRAASNAKRSHDKKTTPKHHTPRKRTIIIIVGALLAICGTLLVAYAYYFWYQSPNKIVSDALINALSAEKGSYNLVVFSPTQTLVTVDGSYNQGNAQASAAFTTDLPGELNKVAADAVMSPQDMSLKIPAASKLSDQLVPTQFQSVIKKMQPYLKENVDGKWVDVTPNDLALFQAKTSVSGCTADAVRDVLTDQRARASLMQLYLQHNFLSVKQISSNDKNVGWYQMTIDQNAFHDFLDSITRSSSGVAFSQCASEIAALKKSTVDRSTIEVVIDKNNRSLTQMTINAAGVDAPSITVRPEFDKKVEIQKPQDTLRFSDIRSQFISLYALSAGR